MAGLGDLVGGFQQGAEFRSKMQDAGQRRQAIDASLGDEAEARLGRRNRITAYEDEYGMTPTDFGSLHDPYEFNLFQTIRNRFGKEGRQQAQGARASRQAINTGTDRMQQLQGMQAPMPAQYADGGTVASQYDDLRARNIAAFEAEQAAAAAPSRAARAAGAVRRGANWAGRAAAPVVLGATAVQTGTTPTEDYRTRFGMELDSGEDASFLGDLGVRTLGAASDLGNALTGGWAGQYYRDKQQPEQAIPSTPEAAAIAESAPAEESTPVTPPAGRGAAAPQSEPFVGEPTPDESASQLGSIDMMPDDMPSMNTRDWVQYRQQAVRDMMLQGKSEREAQDEVTAMQQAGFNRYGQQAAAMLQVGNQQGAARALKAAYQYFPNGADVKFGFQEGQLVTLGLNEETGEPQGTPQVITPEYLAATLANFADPDKFLAWTKDWRDESFQRQKYEEVDKPEAQSMAAYRNASSETARINAEAASIRAINAGGTGGMTNADLRASEATFRDELVMEYGMTDPAVARDLANVMAQIRIRTSPQNIPDNQIIEDIFDAYQAGDLERVKQSLGIR